MFSKNKQESCIISGRLYRFDIYTAKAQKELKILIAEYDRLKAVYHQNNANLKEEHLYNYEIQAGYELHQEILFQKIERLEEKIFEVGKDTNNFKGVHKISKLIFG